jgi:hypothetical protein
VLPLQSIQIVPRSPITNEEAKALYTIWNSDQDEYGNYLVPKEADIMTVASLTTKGMLKNKPHNILSSGHIPSRTVEITNKGKAIIQNIILTSEKSSFEPNSEFDFLYESIHRTSQNGKIASKLENPDINWFQRALKKWN